MATRRRGSARKRSQKPKKSLSLWFDGANVPHEHISDYNNYVNYLATHVDTNEIKLESAEMLKRLVRAGIMRGIVGGFKDTESIEQNKAVALYPWRKDPEYNEDYKEAADEIAERLLKEEIDEKQANEQLLTYRSDNATDTPITNMQVLHDIQTYKEYLNDHVEKNNLNPNASALLLRAYVTKREDFDTEPPLMVEHYKNTADLFAAAEARLTSAKPKPYNWRRDKRLVRLFQRFKYSLTNMENQEEITDRQKSAILFKLRQALSSE